MKDLQFPLFLKEYSSSVYYKVNSVSEGVAIYPDGVKEIACGNILERMEKGLKEFSPLIPVDKETFFDQQRTVQERLNRLLIR